MFRNIIAILLSALAFISCGKSMQDGTACTVAVDSEPSVLLILVDSIGAEHGDSNYVMGGVEGVAFGPDGNIAVLDCGRSCTRIYTSEGEYLRRIGNRGNGPGELQSVTFLAISHDGHVYMSGTGSEIYGVHAFDYFTGEWLESEHTFVPPSCLEGAGENSYVRKTIGFEMQEMERNILRAKAIASDENPAGLEPNPYKPLIRGLEVDGKGNLWVLQGGPSTPTFNVFDSAGEYLYTARVAGNPDDGSTWRFFMNEYGTLAYAEDPASGFQKIYLFEIQE